MQTFWRVTVAAGVVYVGLWVVLQLGDGWTWAGVLGIATGVCWVAMGVAIRWERQRKEQRELADREEGRKDR